MEDKKTKKIDYIAGLIYNEYDQAKRNQLTSNTDFEDALDMLDGVRSKKNYEWNSDVNIPEFKSILNTECSMWGNQYFPTRDFVNIFLESDKPENKIKSDIAKNVINKTLNSKELHYYHKYIRARMLNSLDSKVLGVCWWDKEIIERTTGNTITYNDLGQPVNQPITEVTVVKDMLEFDVIDPRNWFCSNEYVYDIQDKEWVIIRSEISYADIKTNAQKQGYINLDKLDDFFKNSQTETDTSKETYNQNVGANISQTKINEMKNPKSDKLTRFGKVWSVVKSKDEWGYPLSVETGFDDNNGIKESAEYIECIVEQLVKNGQNLIIRLIPQFCHTRANKPYRPLIRGLCYIHPVRDTGMTDYKDCINMQIALNDTINLSNDKTMMSTFPPIIANEYVVTDNNTLTWGPGEIMQVSDINQIREFTMNTNSDAALSQAALFANKMYQDTGIYPPQMGGLPGLASTTATASAGAESNANMRSNYKSLTFEHTFLNPFYWMILQMTYQFAENETIKTMVGEDVMDWFDPDADYTFQPVSSNIELAYNKKNKVNQATQLFGMAMKVPNPNTPKVLNKLMIIALENMDKEFSQIGALYDETQPQQVASGAGGSEPSVGMEGMSNQNNMPMSGQEIQTREEANI